MKARLEQTMHAAWLKRGMLSTVLWPLSRIYAAVAAKRAARYQAQHDRVFHDTVPVVVVGNLYVGGTGKTPVVIALVNALRDRGWHPGVISRGYGARHTDKPRVGTGRLDPAVFGDEPALIAAETNVPVSVHPDRQAAIRRLRRKYPKIDVVISDDGLQHLALGRDLEVVVQDGRGIGNGRLLPAGPLREPPARLQSVDFVINNLLPGEKRPNVDTGMSHVVDMTMAPVLVEHLLTGVTAPWADWLAQHHSDRVAAVAAIGRPERFFSMLRHHGLTEMETRALPDHHMYDESPFSRLQVDGILVTPKDAVKCRKFNDARLYCVHPGPQFSDPGWLTLVDEMLRAISDRKHTAAGAEELNSEL